MPVIGMTMPTKKSKKVPEFSRFVWIWLNLCVPIFRICFFSWLGKWKITHFKYFELYQQITHLWWKITNHRPIITTNSNDICRLWRPCASQRYPCTTLCSSIFKNTYQVIQSKWPFYSPKMGGHRSNLWVRDHVNSLFHHPEKGTTYPTSGDDEMKVRGRLVQKYQPAHRKSFRPLK